MSLEVGFAGNIFMLPYDDLNLLATKSWVKTGWQSNRPTTLDWIQTSLSLLFPESMIY